MEKESDIIQQANVIITEAASKRAKEAVGKVEALRCGEFSLVEGARAVRDANAWLDFIAGPHKGRQFFEKTRFHLFSDVHGRLAIVQGKELKTGWNKNKDEHGNG